MTDSPSVLIFGATGSVGSALTAHLRAQNYRVAVAGRNKEAVEELAGKHDAQPFVAEASSFDQIKEAVTGAQEAFDGLNGVVNCMGSIFLKPAHLTSEEEFMETIAINLTSAFFCVKAAAKAMTKTGGSIALVSSVAATTGLANHESISAAKGGVLGLTLAAASSYASRGIRVNCVSPGLVKSNMTERLWKSDKAREVSEKMHPIGRIGEPEDIARMLAFLVDPANDWITGQNIGVDGGMSTVRPR